MHASLKQRTEFPFRLWCVLCVLRLCALARQHRRVSWRYGPLQWEETRGRHILGGGSVSGTIPPALDSGQALGIS